MQQQATDAANQPVQELCELGQRHLMEMEYLSAERALVEAERLAWQRRDFDALSRLYMPLQEARRQRRQRCGEGTVCLDLLADGPDDRIDGRHVVENFPAGQLLVAGWGTIEPAVRVRQLQAEHGLYLETFLGATYPVGDERVAAIVPLEDAALPPVGGHRTVDELAAQLPTHSIILRSNELPAGSRRGTGQTYSWVMALWERMHVPFLAAADVELDPVKKIEAYRRTICVDYACELAHQKLADAARRIH